MEKKLLDLGFKPTRGIYYLSDAIKIKKQNILTKTCEIYSLVAEKYGVEAANVERCIRHCIKISDNDFNRKKNGQVIATIAISLEEI